MAMKLPAIDGSVVSCTRHTVCEAFGYRIVYILSDSYAGRFLFALSLWRARAVDVAREFLTLAVDMALEVAAFAVADAALADDVASAAFVVSHPAM